MTDPQQARLKVIVGVPPFRICYDVVSLICNDFQAKSKAKKRYLKAKKERRKQRKFYSRSHLIPEEEESDNPEDAAQEKTSAVIDPTKLTERQKLAAKGESPKRNKRKLDDSTAEGPLGERPLQPVGVDEPKLLDEPVLCCALPLFPLPTRPNAPSKTELVLQGLDKAQIEAEYVDPSSTLPINFDSDNNWSLLSLKTRNRLIDLGINDLFAGISFPFQPHLHCAKVEQFRRLLFRSCFGPSTDTPAFTIPITRREMFAFRPLPAVGRRSRMCCQ